LGSCREELGGALGGVFVERSTERSVSKCSRPIAQADLAALTEKVRRRVGRWFRMQRLLDADAAADMLARENSGFSADASVRITLFRLQLRVYRQPLEHLLRYCARPPFALERLAVIRGEDSRIARVRYVLPRHKAANWVGPGRGRKSTRPGASGVKPRSHDTSRRQRPNSWLGWARGFRWSARGAVATSD